MLPVLKYHAAAAAVRDGFHVGTEEGRHERIIAFGEAVDRLRKGEEGRELAQEENQESEEVEGTREHSWDCVEIN